MNANSSVVIQHHMDTDAKISIFIYYPHRCSLQMMNLPIIHHANNS